MELIPDIENTTIAQNVITYNKASI